MAGLVFEPDQSGSLSMPSVLLMDPISIDGFPSVGITPQVQMSNASGSLASL